MTCLIACYSNQPLTYDDGMTLLIGYLGIAFIISIMYLVGEWYMDKQDNKKPKDALSNLNDRQSNRSEKQ